MKKVTFAVLLFGFISSAQISVGIKAGALLGQFHFENSPNEKGKIRPSYYAAAFLDYRYKKIAPEIEIGYVDAGDLGTVKYSQYFDDIKTYEQSKYDAPMLTGSLSLKFYVNDNFKIKFGGYVGKFLSIKNEFKSKTINLQDYWDGTDYGVLLGVEYLIKNHILLEANYNLGLADIRGTSGYAVGNRMAKFGIGYVF